MCMGCCRMRSTLDTLFRQRFDHNIGRGVNVVAKIIPDLHRREKTKAFSFEKAGKQTGENKSISYALCIVLLSLEHVIIGMVIKTESAHGVFVCDSVAFFEKYQ